MGIKLREMIMYSFDAINKVYPLIVGDTTTFFDLKNQSAERKQIRFFTKNFR
jgi:hypothetical protein